MTLQLLAAAALALQDDPRIDDWINALGAPDAKIRSEAADQLLKAGRQAFAPLIKASSEAKNVEIRQRALDLIQKIEWGESHDKLQAYLKERVADSATILPILLKSIQKWFPEVRFYRSGQNVFTLRRFDPSLYPLVINGVLSESTARKLFAREKVHLGDDEEALHFATSFVELYWGSPGWSGMSSGARFIKAEDGWKLTLANYGIEWTFKTNDLNVLQEVIRGVTAATPLTRSDVDRLRDQIARLLQEVDELKRQLEKRQ
ncbi:MAG TPA: hypothetical protein VI643_03945 [Planctomycetota bacterium]|nr:hypothetical protein [Planctomycetota bacterium]